MRDVQEIHVVELMRDARMKTLLAVDERKRRWQIRLSDHRVSELLKAESK